VVIDLLILSVPGRRAAPGVSGRAPFPAVGQSAHPILL